jgi:hypothetical protein
LVYNSMKPLLIYTHATGRYQVYADLFQFAIQCSYPEYDSKVYIDNTQEPKYYGACIRFLQTPTEEFLKYQYFYITDIDMMILREDPGIVAYHLKEMQAQSLCYSNSPRGTEAFGHLRLTGLHFCNHDWYMHTYPARMMYLAELKAGKIGNIAIEDELMLMNIVKESGLTLPQPMYKLVNRHHGIHLGTLRAHSKETIQKRRSHVFIRVSPHKAKQWLEIIGKREYVNILSAIYKKDRMAYNELMEMEKFCQQRAKD